jgi:hypothetical protein
VGEQHLGRNIIGIQFCRFAQEFWYIERPHLNLPISQSVAKGSYFTVRLSSSSTSVTR